MNIEDLKTVWNEYDRKLASTSAINERIIHSMITQRSRTRFSNVKRNYRIGLCWMLICLAVAILILLTNPFDYVYTFQYIPVVIFALGLTILISSLFSSYRSFEKINLSQHNVGDALSRIIAVYERPRKFVKYTLIVFLFSQTVLFPLSFLPRSIERMGVLPALAERLIPIAIALLMLIVAQRFGAFKERHADRFREDRDELESFKRMAAELHAMEIPKAR